LLRFKQEGYVPDRDIILALTADEEGGTACVDWLLRNHLVDRCRSRAQPDGGGILSEHGKPQMMR